MLSNEWKYIFVLIIFIWSVTIFVKRLRRALPVTELDLIPLGLLFTAVADTFLVYLGGPELVGVIFFFLVQLTYSVMLVLFNRDLGFFLLRFGIILGLVIMLAALRVLDVQTGFAAGSMGLLTVNALEAWNVYAFLKEQPVAEGRQKDLQLVERIYMFMFALGITLFFGCDLCVGLYNAPNYLADLDYPTWYDDVTYKGIWLCYLPAQLLIGFAYAMSLPSRKELEANNGR